MYIQKIQKPKDAVRIASENDIPEFLRDTIRIEGDKIICLAAEGYNTSPIGSIIGYDKNAPTATGKGAWPLGEHSYVEKDGVFYPAPEIRKAEKIEAPFSIDTKWGKQTLEVGQEGYLVTSPNGDRNILTLGTSSAADYMVCTEQGVNIAPLPEYARLNSEEHDILHGALKYETTNETMKDHWWLRTPDHRSSHEAYIDSDGRFQAVCVDSDGHTRDTDSNISTEERDVRPALRLNQEAFNLPIGKKVQLYGRTWTHNEKGTLLCDEVVCETPFSKIRQADAEEIAETAQRMTSPEEHRVIGRGGLPGSNKIDTERKNPANIKTKPGTQNISEDINR